jgi:hypothetical protein
MNKLTNDLNNVFHKIINDTPELRELFIPNDNKMIFPEGLRYRFYRLKIGKKDYRYCYSITRNKNGKFSQWIYYPKWELQKDNKGKYKRILTWNPIKIKEYKRKKTAKNHAFKLYCSHNKRLNKGK